MDAAQKGTSEEKLADEELKSAKKVLVAAKARLKFSKARLSELQKTSEIADKYSKSFQTPISPATLSDAGDKQGANDTSLQPSPPAVPSNPIKGVKSLPPPMKLEVPAR